MRPATKKAESATNKSEETCYFEKAAFGVLFLPPMKKFRILIICEEVNLICDGLTHPHPPACISVRAYVRVIVVAWEYVCVCGCV